jgi:hypothetical protein
MDQSDIKYILEVLSDAKTSQDWDLVDDAMETLKEFLDEQAASDEE